MISDMIFTAAIGLMALQDYRKKQVSLLLYAAAAGCGILCMVFTHAPARDLPWRMVPGGILLLAALFSKGRIGAGDGLAFVIAGLFLPGSLVIGVMSLSFMIAAGTAGVLLISGRRKRRDTFPFLPCMLGAWIAIVLYHAFTSVS